MKGRDKLRIGLALGSGAARGWAHIGVIQTLERNGITPDVVCGTSIGALVGATMVAEELDRLDNWVRTLSWQKVIGYFDLTMTGGLIKGEKLFDFFREHLEDRNIEDLGRPFGAVATDLASGREIWLREGEVDQSAICLASIVRSMREDVGAAVDRLQTDSPNGPKGHYQFPPDAIRDAHAEALGELGVGF